MNQAVAVIQRTKVGENKRLAALPRVFGPHLMIRAESAAMDYMAWLCEAYNGGFWEFYDLSNGGFYMAPTGYEKMDISADGNGFTGTMSEDAAGIVACLYAWNALANATEMDVAIHAYRNLREYAFQHEEASAIFRAID